VLLNLWATWCVPCREEMPALDALQGAAGSGKFEVVAVNVDTGSDEKPKRFLEDIKVSKLAFYQEPDLELFNNLKKRGLVLGLPVTLLVGPDGCLRAAMNGPAKWDSPDARTFIDAALKVTGT
jgi:thiol-disulfide isomerase/thioredoxin